MGLLSFCISLTIVCGGIIICHVTLMCLVKTTTTVFIMVTSQTFHRGILVA
jgi:hypothetical protein